MAIHRSSLVAVLGLVMLTAVNAGVVDYDMSPVCVALQPQCVAQCKAPQDYIFVCSAGGGPNGGPRVKCNCVTPAQPAGGDGQQAILQLVDFPGAKACLQKTWVNDCGTTIRTTISGTMVNITPTITSAFGNPCNTQQGIVVGTNQAAVALPEYPLGLMVSNPDGSVLIRFSAFDDGSQNCYATYRRLQGTFLNGTLPQQSMTALGGATTTPGLIGAVAATDNGTDAQMQTLEAILNGANSGMPSLVLLLAVALSALAMLWS